MITISLMYKDYHFRYLSQKMLRKERTLYHKEDNSQKFVT